jgi:3-ketosteroid 9alpha-monooxygenase subunit B
MGDFPARTLDEGHDQARRAHGYHLLRVKEVVQETHDTRSFVLDVPAELADTFGYAAGQFCTFRVRIAGEQHLRSYSMSSAPETDSDLTVTVKRVPGGVVSNWFNDRVAAGDVLELTRPAGVFCVGDGQRPVVAFCGGSGITPVMSIAKSALTTTARPVRLLYANRDRASVIFEDELRSLGDRHAGRLDVCLHLDTDRGFLEAGTVAEFAASAAPGLDGDFYLCGPGPFMDLVEATLLGAGVDAERISIERFDGPGEAAALVPAATGVEVVGVEVAGAEADVPESVTLILGGRKATVGYQQGDTVLQTARRAGLQAPFSCQAGDCATCMAMVREGSATMRVNNALTADEVEEGWVLTCQALPRGRTVTVEYEAF